MFDRFKNGGQKIDLKKWLVFFVCCFGLFGIRVVLASTGSGDFDLTPVGDSIETHMSGDVGKIICLFIFVVTAVVCAFNFNWKMLCTGLLAIIVILKFPGIIDAMF